MDNKEPTSSIGEVVKDVTATVREGAEVVKETSSVIKQGMGKLEQVFSFFEPLVNPVVNQCGQYLADKVYYARVQNAINFKKRVESQLKPVDKDSMKSVPLNVIVPILENALIEEDSTIQEMWASLLVNGVDSDSGVELSKGYIGLLKDMGPMEVQCLSAIVNAWHEPRLRPTFSGLSVNALPDAIIDVDRYEAPSPPPEPVLLALHNLVRLGCLEPYTDFESVHINPSHFDNGVKPTYLGIKLYDACTRDT